MHQNEKCISETKYLYGVILCVVYIRYSTGKKGKEKKTNESHYNR